ncbi:MAG: SH3 domain-containing protein [Tepidisphaeraceae bacterium]
MNKRFLALGAAVLGVAGVVLAEDVWVNRPELELRSAPSGMSDPVVAVKKGDKLTVVSRDGKWIKVKASDTEGYVHENSIAAREVKGGDALGFLGGPEAGGAEASAAGKGLEEQAETYAKGHQYNTALVERMIVTRRSVKYADWQQFAREGNVGPYKKK